MIRSAVLLAATVAAGLSQTFDVASVRPGRTVPEIRAARARPAMVHGPDSINYTDVTLREILRAAFDLRDDQIDGPAWLAEARYTIAAKAAGPVARPVLMKMLQALLAERWSLRFHGEERSLNVQALVPAPTSKLVRAADDAAPPDLLPGSLRITRTAEGLLTLGPQAMPLATFADFLSRMLRSNPVIAPSADTATLFEIKLTWVPDNLRDKPDAPAGPGLITAVRDQLGFVLRGQKAQVAVMAIDAIERVPTGN